MAARGGGGGGGAAHGQEQVSISPADGRLVFSLLPASSSDRTSCWAVMTIANDPSGPCLAFKVKTTKPKRYLVRPSQGTLRPGERRDVTILVPPERQAELLRSLREGNGAPREEDKFQVLYVRVDDRSMGLPGEEQQWVDRFWPEVDRRRVRDCTLDVDFVLSAPSLTAAAASTGPMTMAEYRKRYDDLVTSTVSLTAERDTLLNALDTLKFELRRELASQSERGTHVAAGGTVIQDQLSLHKRRRSKASSVASASSIPGVAAHAREPSSGPQLGATGAGSRHRGEAYRQPPPGGAAKRRQFSPGLVAVLGLVALWLGWWL